MKFIKPKDLYTYLSKEYKFLSSIHPYTIPIFKTIYFGRIKRIVNIPHQLNKNFLKILEVGGGFGLFAANYKLNFPKCDITLSDIYSNKLMNTIEKIMTKIFKIKMQYYYDCDIQKKTTFKNNSFDLIIALDVLEYIYDPNLALEEILRILKNNGLLFISVPSEDKLLNFIRKNLNRLIKVDTKPHWNGKIKSEDEFFECLMNKRIKLKLKIKYPLKFLPKIFSYDFFYLVQKQ